MIVNYYAVVFLVRQAPLGLLQPIVRLSDLETSKRLFFVPHALHAVVFSRAFGTRNTIVSEIIAQSILQTFFALISR